MAGSQTVTVGEQEFPLGPGEYRWVGFSVRQAPAEYSLRYEVSSGPATVHVELLALEELRKFGRKQPYEVIVSSAPSKSAAFRGMIYKNGEYAVVMANAPKAQKAVAALAFGIDSDPHGPVAVELPRSKRISIVVLSLLFLGVTSWLGGRYLLAAMRRSW